MVLGLLLTLPSKQYLPAQNYLKKQTNSNREERNFLANRQRAKGPEDQKPSEICYLDEEGVMSPGVPRLGH